jgi:hypothetical protein
MNRTLCIAVSLLIGASPALAQKKVYRCTEGGRVVYSDAPCKDAAEVKADDSRSDAERRAAREDVKREEQMADKMARERRAQEAAAARQGAAHIPYSAANKAAESPSPASAPRKGKKKPPPDAVKPPQS